MRPSSTLSRGMDVPKASLTGASVPQAPHAAVVSLGNSGTRQWDLAQRLRKRPSNSRQLLGVDEAGPCGSWRSRDLTHKGQVCWGVAPSLRPPTPGERVKPNRREAVNLARLRRAGDLTPVDGPTVDAAAMRDLCRGREEARRARKTAQFRLTACLLRQERRYTGRAPWGPAHLRWLSAVVGPTPAPQIVCPDYSRAGTAHPARLNRLAQELPDQGQTWRLAPVVAALQARRRVPCTGAVTTVAERGDLPRFETPSQRMHDLG
jgi:transposase